MIEFIGVLAVIALLAAIIIPSVIREVDQATVTNETADLAAFQQAWSQAILQNRAISNYTGIPNQIASQLALPLSKITTTSRNRTRSYLIDPALSLPQSGGTTNLPYVQSNNDGLVAAPTSARVLIVSVLSGTNPPIASGVPSSTNFNAIWNTGANAVPATTGGGWPANGREICIQRINLVPLFNQLILINHDSANDPRFSIDGATPSPVTVTNGVFFPNSFYLNGSVVSLCTNTTSLTRYILTRSISYVFENGAWQGGIAAGQNNTNAAGFTAAATTFFNATPNPAVGAANGKGSSQIGVLACMYSYMFDYTLWATETPSFSDHKPNPLNPIAQVPEYRMVMGTGDGVKTVLDDSSNSTKGILQ